MAIEILEKVKYGERESELRLLARRLGYKSDDLSALRRAINAHEFLLRLNAEFPEAYRKVEEVSLSVAELLARWFSTNSAKALATIAAWEHSRGVTVQSIRRAMEEGSPTGHGGKSGRALGLAYHASARKEVISIVESLVKTKVSLAEENARDESGIRFDFVFETHAQVPAKIAVLIVGPYKNSVIYRDRCDEWIARAYGAAWVFDQVVLLIPEAAYLELYRGRGQKLFDISTKRRRADGLPLLRAPVTVLNIYVDPLGSEDSAAIAAFT